VGFARFTSKGYIKVLTDYASDCINILSWIDLREWP
jgi:hypothetical protein